MALGQKYFIGDSKTSMYFWANSDARRQLALLSITNLLLTKILDLPIAPLKKVLKSMKIELAISWDWRKQEEGEVIVDIPESKCKEIVLRFPYEERLSSSQRMASRECSRN